MAAGKTTLTCGWRVYGLGAIALGIVCLALDQAKLPEIAGTIAGDDTLFIAVRSGLPVEPLAERLREFIELG